jgi:hypothetical protein
MSSDRSAFGSDFASISIRPFARDARLASVRWAFSVTLLAVFASGCSDGASVTPTEPTPDPAVVGTSGGSVNSSDGTAGITLPPGAVSSSVRIAVTPQPSAAASNPTVGAAYRFEPSGTQFAVPATMRLKFEEGAFRPGTDLSRLRLARLENGEWVPRGEEIQVNAASREVQGKVTGFSTWGVWADPCLPRRLTSLNQTRNETLVADDCRFQSGDLVRRSQYFDFAVTETTGVELAWSAGMDFVVGIKEDTEDPAVGTVWGSLSGTQANGRSAELRTILAPGSYQLYFSGADETQLGAYQLALNTRTVSEMTSGRGCGTFTLVVPGTSVQGARLSEQDGDCRTTIQFNPDPTMIGRPLLIENYIVRLLPGQTYTVTVQSAGPQAWAPGLTVYAGGQVRAQRLPDGSGTLSVELTPPSLTYYTLEVSALVPAPDDAVQAPGYGISVTGGSGPVPASVSILSGPIGLTVPGDTVHARARVERNGSTLPGAQVQWVSSNPAIAQVSSGGIVTAVAAGSTTLRASWGAGSATVPVTVDPTKLALVPLDTVAIAAGSFAGFRLRTGTFPEGTTARFSGAPASSTVDNGTLLVWVPLGPSGSLDLAVESTVNGALRSATLTLQRASVPTPPNPALYLSTLSGQLDQSLLGLRSGGAGTAGEGVRGRNVDRAAALLASGSSALSQLTDEQRATVATLLAAGGGAGASATSPSAASIPAWCQTPSTIVTRAGHRVCAEAVLAAQTAAAAEVRRQELLCEKSVRLESMGSILSALEALSLRAKACVRWFALSIGQEAPPVESPLIQRRLRSRDTVFGIRGVAGEEPTRASASGAPLVFRSGIASPLYLTVEVSNPTAADTGIPLGQDLVVAVGYLQSLWTRLRALVDSNLESEAPTFRSAESKTLETEVERSEIRLVSVGREGVQGELVTRSDGGLGLRLRGPSSGGESFLVTVETTDARVGTLRTEIPVRLDGGYPEIQNAWLQQWLQVRQDPFCNGQFPQGTNGHSRIRLQLTEPLPTDGRFIKTTYWVGGSGFITIPVSAFQRVGENLYQVDNYVHCWGGPTGTLDLEFQFEAADGTRTNTFRFRLPRP